MRTWKRNFSQAFFFSHSLKKCVIWPRHSKFFLLAKDFRHLFVLFFIRNISITSLDRSEGGKMGKMQFSLT